MTGAYVPTAPVLSDPSNKVCVNHEWCTFVLGLLEPGTIPKHWETVLPVGNTLEERESVAEGIMSIQAELAKVPDDCVQGNSQCVDGTLTNFSTNFGTGPFPFIISLGTQTAQGIEPIDYEMSSGIWTQRARVIIPSLVATACVKEFGVQYDWDAELYISGVTTHGNNINVELPNGGNITMAHAEGALNSNMYYFNPYNSGLFPVNSIAIDLFCGRWVGQLPVPERLGRIRSCYFSLRLP